MPIQELPTLDTLLARHAQALGSDHEAYRNHVYRVINFCAALAGNDAESLEKRAIAGAFHDLGIWTDNRFDYLDVSEMRAMAYLDEIGRPDWRQEIGTMIQQHHKITRLPAAAGPLAEAFRKADWIDVLKGRIDFGLPRPLLREVFACFPNAGFHRRLMQLSRRRLRTHPWSPMPMMRW